MRLTLICSSLDVGGAERVISILTRCWAAKGWELTILTFNGGQTVPFYALDPAVRHIPLKIAGVSANLWDGIGNNLRRLMILRREIRRSEPEVVLSFIDRTNVMALLATIGLGVPVVVAERSDPNLAPVGRSWDILRRLTYRRAERIVVQSRGAAIYFSSGFRGRLAIIPNPVPAPPHEDAPAQAPERKPSLISMGRLAVEKRFDILLQAFARIAGRHGNWSLTIYGEGPERAALERQMAELGLVGRVRLPGLVRDPYHHMRQADVFVLSSSFEGFPNALCEAMACGLPAVATDCPSGPREIIRHEVDGLLVENGNVAALAEGMERLMSDAKLRRRLASQAVQVTERFAPAKISAIWERILIDAAGRKNLRTLK